MGRVKVNVQWFKNRLFMQKNSQTKLAKIPYLFFLVFRIISSIAIIIIGPTFTTSIAPPTSTTTDVSFAHLKEPKT